MPYEYQLVYHDCSLKPQGNTVSYSYHSKICDLPPKAYLFLTRADTLVPAIQALHTIEESGDPDQAYTDIMQADHTPRTTAEDLESRFRMLGFGLPECSPLSCDALASGIRLFQFGALETLLGYRYGDRISRTYADASARLALAVQVGGDGIIRTDHGRYYRPAAVGGFYESWNARGEFSERQSVAGTVATWLISKLNVPPEYGGIVVSNSETTLDAYAFLTLYRCARYGVGCVCRHSERAKDQVLSAWRSTRIHETGPPRGSVAAQNDRRAARPCV